MLGTFFFPVMTKAVCHQLSLYRNCMQQDHFDMLLVNLRMDSTCVKESMNIKWISENGIVENMAAVVKDFKETRGLLVVFFISVYIVVISCFIF